MNQDNSSDLYPPPPPESAGKRNIRVIGLAIACAVLAASLITVFAVYQPTSLQAQLSDKNSQIKDLSAQISSLTAQLNSNATDYQNQIQSLNSELTNLTAQVNSAKAQLESASNIMTMNVSETLVSAASKTIADSTNVVEVFANSLPYPGYLVVQATSNSTTTYAQVIYNAYGVNYNQNATLGKTGTAVFPVLPTTVDVRIGTTDKTATNATVTITYHY